MIIVRNLNEPRNLHENSRYVFIMIIVKWYYVSLYMLNFIDYKFRRLPIEVDLINFLQLCFLCKFEKEVSYLLKFLW